ETPVIAPAPAQASAPTAVPDRGTNPGPGTAQPARQVAPNRGTPLPSLTPRSTTVTAQQAPRQPVPTGQAATQSVSEPPASPASQPPREAALPKPGLSEARE